MGRGDRKTMKGKLFRKSFGKSRPHNHSGKKSTPYQGNGRTAEAPKK